MFMLIRDEFIFLYTTVYHRRTCQNGKFPRLHSYFFTLCSVARFRSLFKGVKFIALLLCLFFLQQRIGPSNRLFSLAAKRWRWEHVRALKKALTYHNINGSQRHLLPAIEIIWLGVPIHLSKRNWVQVSIHKGNQILFDINSAL